MESITQGIRQLKQYSLLFQNLVRDGIFQKLWKKVLSEYDELEGVAWKWQSIDGAMNKASLAQEDVDPNSTDRGGDGIKRNLLVDERGVPLSIFVTGANRHDVTQAEAGLSSKVRKPRERI